ncbi:hypothetical protein A3759_10470 [Thalassolituus sp. HI0120]|nr:hypothetical protein A3759_10470 [Thalassolituus sp. HI0120]
MKYLTLFVVVLLSACISEDDEKDSVTNQDGENISSQTQDLNGFWSGQFNQAGAVRFLIFNGDVYGFDEKNGFAGTVTFDANTLEGKFTLAGCAFSEEDTAAKQFVAEGGSAVDYEMSPLLTTVAAKSDTLVGDFSSGAGSSQQNGTVLLTNDGTWPNNSSLSSLQGKWTATGFELYIQQATNKSVFEGIALGDSGGGCTFSGDITIIDKDFALYRVALRERKNCKGFNTTAATGYAAVNKDEELEFYLKKGDDQLFMQFTAPSSGSDDSSDTPTDGGETPAPTPTT